jgi:hypothetical protein
VESDTHDGIFSGFKSNYNYYSKCLFGGNDSATLLLSLISRVLNLKCSVEGVKYHEPG